MKANKATWAGMSGAALPGNCWFGALQLCRTKLAKLLGPVRARQPCRATAGLGASALPYEASKHGMGATALTCNCWFGFRLCQAQLAKLLGQAWALQLCRATTGLGNSCKACLEFISAGQSLTIARWD